MTEIICKKKVIPQGVGTHHPRDEAPDSVSLKLTPSEHESTLKVRTVYQWKCVFSPTHALRRLVNAVELEPCAECVCDV